MIMMFCFALAKTYHASIIFPLFSTWPLYLNQVLKWSEMEGCKAFKRKVFFQRRCFSWDMLVFGGVQGKSKSLIFIYFHMVLFLLSGIWPRAKTMTWTTRTHKYPHLTLKFQKMKFETNCVFVYWLTWRLRFKPEIAGCFVLFGKLFEPTGFSQTIFGRIFPKHISRGQNLKNTKPPTKTLCGQCGWQCADAGLFLQASFGRPRCVRCTST